MATVGIAPTPILQFFNNAGQPNVGGSVLTQVGGVNYATYQDAAGTIPLPNPIPLNSRGEISNSSGQSCQLFLVAGVTYVFTQYDPLGNQINQVPYMAGSASQGALSSSSGANYVGTQLNATGSALRTQASKNSDSICASDFAGVDPTGATDSTAGIQAAINWCIANNKDLEIVGNLLINPAVMVNIDRQVDGAAYDNYFKIFSKSGGGFTLSGTGAMFSSSISFTTAPVSQLICFEGINFIAPAAGAYYVLNDGRFLRMVFDKCSFDKILCVNSSIYLQTYRFIACNARRGSGQFFTAVGQTYDLKSFGLILESWTGNFCSLAQAIGCAFMGGLMEGVAGTAIVYNGAGGLAVHGVYFEANTLDIDGTGATQANGVSLLGNYFSHTTGNSNPTTYSVVWSGNISNCVSMGNYSNAYLHNFPSAGMDCVVKDSASGNLWSNEPNPIFSHEVSLNDGALGGGYGGTVKGYGVSGSGGFLGLGVLNAGVYTEGITIDQTGKSTLNNAAVVKGSTPTVSTNELGLGYTSETTATAGTAALPSAPATFLVINLSGNVYKIPLYNN
jgi:hypothetical protein